MLLYKYTGFIAGEKDTDGDDGRRSFREKRRNTFLKTADFNSGLHSGAYIFVSEYDGDNVTGGIITGDSANVPELIDGYSKALALELSDILYEEITFDKFSSIVGEAERYRYIDDEDKVYETFGLSVLTKRIGRFVSYGDNVIEEAEKDEIYKKSNVFLSKKSFLAELDRIYAGPHTVKFNGHPVHYMIETDDHDTRKTMHRLLIKALYANARIKSKRYTFMDFEPDDEFSVRGLEDIYKANFGGTIIIRYLSNELTEGNMATGERNTIKNLCAVMKKFSNNVLTIFCLPRECTKIKAFFFENLENINIVELTEDRIGGEEARNYLTELAGSKDITPDNGLFSRLENGRNYIAPELKEIFDKWYDGKLKTEIFPQYSDAMTVTEKIINEEPKCSAYDELDSLIGLDEAKKTIRSILDFHKANKLFTAKGLKIGTPSMHMVFTGNPGTAKTTVARLFAEIMRENNVLSKGELIEVGRADIVGQYVGQTAPLVKKHFAKAKGSVLFIDEAYSLVDGTNGYYGDEAINTIVQEMENHRDDVVVILAGYPDKMEQFLDKNPGLRSRIAFNVSFSDYNPDELCRIADHIADKKGLTLSDEASIKLRRIFENASGEKDFGNGRFVRKTIEQAAMAHASRLLSMDYGSLRSDDIVTISADDIESPKVSTARKTAIGFGG